MIASHHAAAEIWPGKFDDAALQQWLEEARARLPAGRANLGLVFLTSGHLDRAPDILELVQVHGRVGTLVGCSASGVIANDREVEDQAAVAVALFDLPGASIRAIPVRQREVDEANGPAYWHGETGLEPEAVGGWLVFADPFTLDCETWLRQWNEAYPAVATFGGLASGDSSGSGTRVFLNQDVLSEGAVAVAIGGAVGLHGVISQGCNPIGRPWTITAARENVIERIGNQPAFEVLRKTVDELSPGEKERAQGNLFVGVAVNEYLEDHHRGDFLVRNLLGGDPGRGLLAVGARVRVGQTIQFQLRDAVAATEDLTVLLEGARDRLANREVFGACLCSCTGRGRRLFGRSHHDAALSYSGLGHPLALAGFFCNGEVGPVGACNFVHGYTASLALFVSRAPGSRPGVQA